MDIYTIITTLFILFVIRLTTVIVCFPANFESLWRPGNQSEFSVVFSSIILAIVAIYAIYLFYKQVKECENKIKISFFIYFAVIYLFLCLFSRDIHNTFSYQYVVQNYHINISEILPYLKLDLFSEKPFAFWGLLFMAINFILFYKRSKLEIAIIMWVIPFCFINYMKFTDIIFVYILTLLISMIFGIKFSVKNFPKILNPYLLYAFQFLITLAVVLYVSNMPSRAYTYKYFMQLLAMFYIPGLVLMLICSRSNCRNAITSSWIIPSVTGFSIILPLLRIPTTYCFLHTLGFINTYIFAGNIAIVVGLITLISLCFKAISKSLTKIVFYLLSFFAVGFYLLDFILFLYSHFRLNYQTLRWTSTMNNIWESTLKTCMAYVSSTTLFFVTVFIVLLIFLAVKGKETFRQCYNIRFSFLMIILSAQISCLLMLMSDAMPFILRDSFVEMLKSMPNLNFTEKKLSMDNLKDEFKKCGINLKEYEEKEVSNNSGINLVLITLESVHWKYLDFLGDSEHKTWPELSKLTDRMEVFPFFFSNYPESSSGDFTVVSGLQSPSHIYIENKNAFNYSNIVSELKKNGYTSHLFCSGSIVDGNRISIVKSMPFDSLFYFETGKIKEGQKSWSWGYKEQSTIDEILLKLKDKKDSKPYFLWYRMVCPHAPFNVLEGTYDYLFTKDDKNTNQTVVDYKNSLLYIDKVISRLIKSIDELNSQSNQKTIFALVADHGEMLGEPENKWLRGHGPYTSPELTAIPFIIISQDIHGLKIYEKFGSQIDVLPTLLDKLKISPSTRHFGFGESLFSDFASRPIYLSSIHSMALVENGYYFDFRDKKSPNVIISKVSMASDSRPIFIPVNVWSPKDIQEKFTKANRFFELNNQLMNDY